MPEKQGDSGNRNKEIIGHIKEMHNFYGPELIELLNPDSRMYAEYGKIPLNKVGIKPEGEEHRDQNTYLFPGKHKTDKRIE